MLRSASTTLVRNPFRSNCILFSSMLSTISVRTLPTANMMLSCNFHLVVKSKNVLSLIPLKSYGTLTEVFNFQNYALHTTSCSKHFREATLFKHSVIFIYELILTNVEHRQSSLHPPPEGVAAQQNIIQETFLCGIQWITTKINKK